MNINHRLLYYSLSSSSYPTSSSPLFPTRPTLHLLLFLFIFLHLFLLLPFLLFISSSSLSFFSSFSSFLLLLHHHPCSSLSPGTGQHNVRWNTAEIVYFLLHLTLRLIHKTRRKIHASSAVPRWSSQCHHQQHTANSAVRQTYSECRSYANFIHT